MGIGTRSWASNPAFWMILFLGFIVYILWSILLDSMVREWSKRLVTVFEALHDALLKQRWSTREGARKVIVLVAEREGQRSLILFSSRWGLRHAEEREDALEFHAIAP